MIIVDTGAWIGLADRRDRYHEACKRFFARNREPLITTCPVLVESVHLLYRRIGVTLTLAWINVVQTQGIHLFSLQVEHLPQLAALMQRYADLPMDLADASLVLLAEQQNDGRIVSTDERDFQAYRWKDRHPFHNLLWHQDGS